MTGNLPYRQAGLATAAPGGILCVADHASNHVPPDIKLGIAPGLLGDHIALDIGVEGIADALAQDHGIPAHIARISRLVCDLHRREDEPAVVPVLSDGHHIPGNVGVDREDRLARFHRPYHDALGALIDRLKPRLILALHSFTPQLATGVESRPWEVALLYNRDARAAAHAMRLFAAEGLTVGDNEPYSGKQLNATMDRHAEARGIPYCTVEIRQDEIADKARQQHWATLLAGVMRKVADVL